MLDSLYPIIYYYPNGEGGGEGGDSGDSGDSGGGSYEGGDGGTDYTSDTMADLSDVQIESTINPVLLKNEFTKEGTVTFPLIGTVGTRVGVDNHISTIKFRAKPGYYYSKVPTPELNFPGASNYSVLPVIGARDADGRIVEVTYTVYYNGAENVFEFDQHNIQFLHETKPLPEKPNFKEIFKIDIDQTDIPAKGKIIPIKITGTPEAAFSIDITDENNRNILTPQSIVTKVVKNTITRSNRIDLNNVENIKVGMQVSGGNVGDGVTVSSVGDDTANFIVVSKPQTINSNTPLTFTDVYTLSDIKLPSNGIYVYKQRFPNLRKYTKTLKTAASSTTTLTLDDTTNLKVGMRMTGTGVDGNNPTISTIDTDTQITVSDSQTISDETQLSFTQDSNQYNITITPKDGVKLYSDIPVGFPTYSIKQYIDPIVTIEPSTTLSSVTVTGSTVYTKPINHKPEITNVNQSTASPKKNLALATISMVATSTSGAIAIDRQPRFSTKISSSDFTNLSVVKKRVAGHSGSNTPLVVLNNSTDLVVGMRVTGKNIEQPAVYSSTDTSKGLKHEEVTIKTIHSNGNIITLSSPQTLSPDQNLTFDNGGTFVKIKDLSATLGNTASIVNGKCTVTGTAVVSRVGKYSLTSTINFDDFLSKA